MRIIGLFILAALSASLGGCATGGGFSLGATAPPGTHDPVPAPGQSVNPTPHTIACWQRSVVSGYWRYARLPFIPSGAGPFFCPSVGQRYGGGLTSTFFYFGPNGWNISGFAPYGYGYPSASWFYWHGGGGGFSRWYHR